VIRLDHLTVSVRDYKAARDWYATHLGLRVEFEIPERGVAAMQDGAGFTVFLEQSPVPTANCVLYFQVDSVDDQYERLIERGVAFTIAPSKQFWGYGPELTNPDGLRIRFWDAASMKTKGE